MPVGMTKPSLPTLDRLQVTVPSYVNALAVATAWLEKLSELLIVHANGNARSMCIDALFLEDATWKDTLAMTWDYRTIQGIDAISTLLKDRASSSGIAIEPSAIATDLFLSPALVTPFPDLSWVQFGFGLKTAVGRGQGFARLVPTSDGAWKGYTIWTSLESLSGFVPPVSTLALTAATDNRADTYASISI